MVRQVHLSVLILCYFLLLILSGGGADKDFYDEDYYNFDQKCDKECEGVASITGFMIGGLVLLFLIGLFDPTAYGRSKRSINNEGT